MKKFFSFYYAVIFVLVFLTCPNVISAQGPGGGPGPCTNPPCDPPNPPGLPIDGGAIFLLGSGLVYAVSKLRKKVE